MRFSGHETFAVREGWLHKGLKLLIEEPDLLFDEFSADWLGVGKNMAKSIRHWLEVTGLAERQGIGKQARLKETELGRLVYEKDVYFNEIGTWWALHVNLVGPQTLAYTWSWFFNSFNLNRFDRSVCVESLRRNVQLSNKNMPSVRTLERDVGCLLSSYARTIPPVHDDPEDAWECPFSELGLISHFRTSGYYQLHQGVKEIPSHVFGYALAKAFVGEGEGTTDIPLLKAARQPGGPGRAFVLTSESLFEMASRIENETRGKEIQIAGLAGNRVIRVQKQPAIEWVKGYYAQVERRDRHAA